MAAIRRESQIPIVLYIYFNLIHRYGLERFIQDAAQAGEQDAQVHGMAYQGVRTAGHQVVPGKQLRVHTARDKIQFA